MWHQEHWNLVRISINSPPQTGQAGRVGQVVLFVLVSLFYNQTPFKGLMIGSVDHPISRQSKGSNDLLKSNSDGIAAQSFPQQAKR
jgi:hypothetical protein